MRPSEIIEGIGDIKETIVDHETYAAKYEEQAKIERLKASHLRGVHASLVAALDAGEGWPAIEALLQNAHGDPAQNAAESPAPVRLRKSDGLPAEKPGRKPRKAPPAAEHVTAGRTSPLTLGARKLIDIALVDGPLTIAGLRASTGLDDVESLLCEDPAAYVSWKIKRPGDTSRGPVWGTIEFFDLAVGSVQLQCAKSERAKWTAAALDCSLAAAHEAWLRLDPPGAS
jgi:hypothetical protein